MTRPMTYADRCQLREIGFVRQGRDEDQEQADTDDLVVSEIIALCERLNRYGRTLGMSAVDRHRYSDLVAGLRSVAEDELRAAWDRARTAAEENKDG